MSVSFSRQSLGWCSCKIYRQSLITIYIYLLNKLNAGLQVHTEVNELPDNTLLLVLFLLQYKHVMVEELLQTLVSVVDEQLFKSVQLQIGIISPYHPIDLYIFFMVSFS